MAYVIAVLMACLSFLLNRFFLRCLGPASIISTGPVVEEAAKTLFGYYLEADIITVHAVFGLLEAGYDWRQGGRHKLLAALLSIGGHSLFGAASAKVLVMSGSVWPALGAGVLLHIGYNVMVVRLLVRQAADSPGKRDAS